MQLKPLFSPSRAILALVLTMLSASAAADRPFSTLEERMTGQEFRETGLHKLSDEELAALNRWIRRRSLAEGEPVATAPGAAREPASASAAAEPVDRRGLPSTDRADRSPISSRIVGSFSGWEGNTRFQLENGMVWQATGADRYQVATVENPAVEIRPGAFNTWRMRVDGVYREVRVQRVR